MVGAECWCDSVAASHKCSLSPSHREQQQAPPQAADDVSDDTSKNMEPKFIRGPANAQVQEGKLVRFEARATGRPYPEVSSLWPGRTHYSATYMCLGTF